jgi:thiol-disulfide isomerase/thioredoxin
MFKKKSIRRELIEIGIILGLASLLYLTGLHIEVIGGVKRLFLQIGLNEAKTEIIQEGQDRATYNFNLVTLDGKNVNFEMFKGKTVFLNIWATWCPPCIAEMPDIHTLYKDIANEDIVFVMLSTDEDANKVRRFIDRKGFTFPVYRMTEQLPAVFWTQSIPATFVISPEGKIIFKKLGIANYNTNEFKELLLKL